MPLHSGSALRMLVMVCCYFTSAQMYTIKARFRAIWPATRIVIRRRLMVLGSGEEVQPRLPPREELITAKARYV